MEDAVLCPHRDIWWVAKNSVRAECETRVNTAAMIKLSLLLYYVPIGTFGG